MGGKYLLILLTAAPEVILLPEFELDEEDDPDKVADCVEP